MRKLITAHNFVGSGYSQKNLLSATVPGQVLTVEQIIARYQRGQGVQTFSGAYDSPIPPEWDAMDRLQKLEFAKANAKNIARQRRVLANAAKMEEAKQTQMSDLDKDKSDDGLDK